MRELSQQTAPRSRSRTAIPSARMSVHAPGTTNSQQSAAESRRHSNHGPARGSNTAPAGSSASPAIAGPIHHATRPARPCLGALSAMAASISYTSSCDRPPSAARHETPAKPGDIDAEPAALCGRFAKPSRLRVPRAQLVWAASRRGAPLSPSVRNCRDEPFRGAPAAPRKGLRALQGVSAQEKLSKREEGRRAPAHLSSAGALRSWGIQDPPARSAAWPLSTLSRGN